MNRYRAMADEVKNPFYSAWLHRLADQFETFELEQKEQEGIDGARDASGNSGASE